MITLFTQVNLFTCFFKKKLNNFLGFITPVVEKWLIHIEGLVAAPVLLVLSRALRKHFHYLEEIIRCSGKLQRYNSI